MAYVVWAKQKGSIGQVNYTFEVKGVAKKKRFVFDTLGWYKINFFNRPQEFNIFLSQRYVFLNIKKIAFWSYRNIDFKPKAYKLIFHHCLFLIIQKNKL